MQKIELKILGISSGHTAASYTLILEEIDGERKLPVVIGSSEAQSIAVQIEGVKPVRPMTHDLVKSIMDAYDLVLDEVIISKLEEGIFYANLLLSGNGNSVEIDARTSDAIAIALRFGCPIFSYESIMNEAGIILSEREAKEFARGEEDEEEMSDEEFDEVMESLEEGNDLRELSLPELKSMLEEAIEDENYDLAAKIRDEISTRGE